MEFSVRLLLCACYCALFLLEAITAQQAEWEASNVAFANAFVTRSEPQIAMKCGFINMHYNITLEQWIPDKESKSQCLTQKMDILEFCRRVYPSLDITNVVEEAEDVKISNWCMKHHKSCKWTHIVRPYRCLVGPFQSDPLLVPEHCLFDNVHNSAKCWTFQQWHRTANNSCSSRRMNLRSFAMLLPCGIDVFSGVEFVCCPKSDETGELPVPSTGVRETDRYFYHVSKEHEHQEFQAALQRIEEKHRTKVTKVMKEWAELEERYQDMRKKDPKGAEKFKTEMTSRFEKTVGALEEEGQAEKRQLRAVHQQRVEARLNENKRVAMDSYLEALKQTPLQAHKVLKTILKFIRAEEKDRLHSIGHYKHLMRTDPDVAKVLKDSIREHLKEIDQRINQSIAMLERLPEIARKIMPEVVEFRKEFEDEVNMEENEVILHPLSEADKDRILQQGKIELSKLQEDDKEDIEVEPYYPDIDEDDDDEEDEDDFDEAEEGDEDDDDEEEEKEEVEQNQEVYSNYQVLPERNKVAVETDKMEMVENEKKAIEEAMEDLNAELVRSPHHHQHNSLGVETNFIEKSHRRRFVHSNSLYIAICVGIVALLVAIVAAILIGKKRHSTPDGFDQVSTVSPEEKHVVSMQVNGYENPTYKYFEAYSK